MKKILLGTLIFFLFFVSCGPAAIPNKETDSRHPVKIEFSTYPFPYESMKIMDVGTSICYMIAAKTHYCHRVAGGYIMSQYEGGTVFIKNEDF